MTLACDNSSLTIPPRPPYADVAAAYVTAVARHFGFAAALSRALGQALGLVLNDLFAAAFEPGDPQGVSVACERLPRGLKIRLREQGLPLTPAELASLAPAPPACLLLRRGRQLVCVREFWDEAAFHHLGRDGAEIHLVKYLPGDSPPAVCPAPPPDPAPAPEPPETFQVRPFVPADALAVSRLFYRTYGYTYPFEHLYDPDRLTALNAEGSLRSLVAVSSGGEVAGHLALFLFHDPAGLVEIGAALVHPAFRGRGCLRQLAAAALAEAETRRLPALCGRPVTNHPYSQRAIAELGFVPCGLYAGFGVATMSFKKIHENLSQRESVLVVYRTLSPWTPPVIFPPAHHRDFILQLYGRLGLQPSVGPPGPAAPDRPGALDLRTYQGSGIAIIRVTTIGSDTLADIVRTHKRLCQSRFDIIHLELDLSQPGAFHLAPSCEARGFFFAGILPRPGGPQTLVLQYLNNVPLDYGQIQLYSPQAAEILAYVQARDPNRL